MNKANDSFQLEPNIGVRRSGLVHSAESDILRLQQILREGYASGFTIFKELLQNAEDAGAKRLVVVGHRGIPGAVNPLLQAPGLIVANDGIVLSRHMTAITRASGGSKADERHAVGRFGIGQKSVYHLCDAFIAFGQVEDDDQSAQILIMNPWEQISDATAASDQWPALSNAEARSVAERISALGFQRGMALFLPLRTDILRPGPSLSLSEANWVPDQAIDDIISGDELAVALCCLRSLETIEIRKTDGSGRLIAVQAGSRRLAGPGIETGEPLIEGAVEGVGFPLSFIGRQQWQPMGNAAALLKEPGWDKVFDIHRRLIPPKANPHSAAIICRSSRDRNAGTLRLRHAVYLPLGSPLVSAPLEAGSADIDILIHGYSFVSSDRKRLRDDDHIEARWNDALRREGSLPLLLDALAAAFPSLANDQERYAVIKALGYTSWWDACGADVCQGRALARNWSCGKDPDWRVGPVSELRPMPQGAATTLSALRSVWPDIEQWCASNGVSFAFGRVLSDQEPKWPDNQLADLVRRAGAAAFLKSAVAETLATLLDAAAPGPQTKAALADCYRAAAALTEDSFARAEKLKPLVRHLPSEQVFVLPTTIENRTLIQALVSCGQSLPVKASWLSLDIDGHRKLGLDETVDLLTAVEPFLTDKGEVASQSSAVVSFLLRHGPQLDLLVRYERAQQLRVIPARWMQNETEERLSLQLIAGLKQKGLLFDPAPNSELPVLAAAIASPAIYRLGLKDGGIEDLASAKKQDCLLAVLRQAVEFDDPAKCGQLAEMLSDAATPMELRRLVSLDPQLPADAILIELDRLDDVLAPLVDALIRTRHGKVVPSAVTNNLKKVTLSKIGLQRLDVETLGAWLAEASDAGNFPDLDDAVAIALLKSGLGLETLTRLPLHKCEGSEGLFPSTDLYLGRRSDIPPRLAEQARLVDLWPDQAASSVQNQLIARWSPEAILQTCLAASQPSQFTTEICEALAQSFDLSDDLIQKLKQTAWITAAGSAWSPQQVIDLPLTAERAFEALSDKNVALLLASRLPNCLRASEVRGRLGSVLPNRSESFGLAFLFAADSGLPGLCVDTVQSLDDLRTIARSVSELDIAAWPLLKALFLEELSAKESTEISCHLAAPDADSVIEQLNAFAGLATKGVTGEAARRLYRSAFFRNFEALRTADGYLPGPLMAPSMAGEFCRADTLALNSEGVAPSALLARDYADALGLEEPAQATCSIGVVGDLRASLERALAPLQNLDVGDGLLLALAMIGRDNNVRALASQWEGQRPFDRICDDLDRLADEQREMRNANQDRLAELRFDIKFPEDGLVSVRSASGSQCSVPLSGTGEVLLIECTQLGLERDVSGYRHVWRLVFGNVEPKDEADAKALLEQFVRRIAPALMLGLDRHKQAVSDLLHSYFANDQRTLSDTCDELKEVLHDRLRGLKPGAVMAAALRDYDRDCFRDRDAAREALWSAAQSEAGSAELLAATRRKIREMGYVPSRTLFELYQNAVDAQAQWQGEMRFQIAVVRNADRSIAKLSVVHWGRPVNQPGRDPHRAELEGHRRDLSNMLAINHSAKDGENVTGRFGLGFKTVHMLAEQVMLASAGIAIHILGGMIPTEWPQGRQQVARFNDRGRKATLIEIPIAPELQDEAATAWDAFVEAAPLLAALGDAGSITLEDDKKFQQFSHVSHNLVEGVRFLAIDSARYVLSLSLGDGFRLFVPFGGNGPHAFTDKTPQFWHLVPLVGERRRGGWLMEGRFPVDPGRTQFSGAADVKHALFAQLGHALGHRLTLLHDYLIAHYDSFARQTGLDPAGQEEFWRRLVHLFAVDLAKDGPERALHTSGGGLAALLANRPLVPLAFGGVAIASGVQWRLTGAMADPGLRALVGAWPVMEAFKDGLIDAETADLLAKLGLPRGQPLSLGTLISALSVGKGISSELAASLAPVLSKEMRAAVTGEEERDIRQILRDRPWLAEDGSWQPIRLLAFPNAGDGAETGRAAFAPKSGRIASSYCAAGQALAAFAREQAGHNETVWQAWAASANSSAQRQTAFIRYVVAADQRSVSLLLQSASWLPIGRDLANSPLLDELPSNDRTLLLAKLGLLHEQPVPESSYNPTAIIDSEAALSAIARWWRDKRGELVPAYHRAVYPEQFSRAALLDGNQEAWFTILSLASFQTLGRIRPHQSRQFVANAIQEGWWSRLALIEPGDEALDPFLERLRAWSEPDADESYLIWRRCLTDLCMIARHLESYRRLFLTLPAVLGQEGQVSLRNHLRPAFSQVAARMGIEAAPIARSLGIGANWLVRELVRHGVYSQEQAERVMPYAWSSADRVRRLLHKLDLGPFPHGIDEGRLLHQAVEGVIGDQARFSGDGDLPLHIITLAKHSCDLADILQQAGVNSFDSGIEEESEGDDDA